MDSEVRELLENPEGNRLDFKRAAKLKDDDGIAKHLVAFANRYGGQLVFGVTDDGQLEGGTIDQEAAFETVRRVARVRCNPPVGFEERFYEHQSRNERTGDVLAIDIHPKQSSPHAVVEGDNNAARTYYVRTADESRLITDAEELRHLFVNSADPSFEEGFRTAIVHETWTYEPLELRPALDGWRDYRRFFEELTEDDRAELKDRETRETDDGEQVGELRPTSEESFGSQMLREVFPIVLFHSFRHRSHDFWIRDRVSNTDEHRAYLQHTDELSHDDLTFANESVVLSELFVDLDRVFRGRGSVLSVPKGMKAVAEFPESSDAPATLMFQHGRQLTVEIGIFSNNNPSVIGPPLGYPGSIPDDAAPHTRRYVIGVAAEFGFPDREDPNIRLHEAFAEGIRDFVGVRWDMESYREQQPHHELFRIGETVDSIEEQLSKLQN